MAQKTAAKAAKTGQKKTTGKKNPPVKERKNNTTSASPKKKKKKKPTEVKINLEFCKGCGICIAFCPTQTLGFHKGKATVAYPENCIGCTFCELRCPDFAISVEEK